jgi:triacylglycerol lipase
MYDIKFGERFDSDAQGFHSGNAYCLGIAAKLAYEPEDKVLDAISSWGLDGKFYDRRGTQALLACDDRAIVVAFRGTEPKKLRDWFTDLDAELVPGAVGRVHHGFSRALRYVWDEIYADIERIRQQDVLDLGEVVRGHPTGKGEKGGHSLWLTGHSLGGALATLAAGRLSLGEPDRPVRGLYTFGQPRVGDAAFARAFNATLKAKSFRFVNNNDVVTRVAPRSLGYSHIGSLRYFDADKDMHDGLARWDRFLDRVKGRFEDFLEVFQDKDLMPDGIDDHSMDEGYIPGLKKALAAGR